MNRRLWQRKVQVFRGMIFALVKPCSDYDAVFCLEDAMRISSGRRFRTWSGGLSPPRDGTRLCV
jgi:hypothetical protein